MSIRRIDPGLPPSTKISQLNDMILELNGQFAQGKFNKNELDALYDNILASRKFIRDVGIGNTTTTYTGWSHLYAESAYSIWKYTPTNYTYSALNQLYFDNRVLENRGSASSESATTFDKVFLFNGDSGSGYTDNTTEAGTVTGTQFSVNDTTRDYLYVGGATTFSGIKFVWHTRGSNYTLNADYWTGTAWVTLTAASNAWVDGTNNFQSDGHLSWNIPTNWNTTSVNSQTKYWIRIYTTTNPITVGKAYYMIPATSVVGLLALSSSEVLSEDWAWCSYNGSIYVTIRNQGAGSTEGDFYITSSSSATNLQNFFIYNHGYTLDHYSSLYNPCKEVTSGPYTILDTDCVILARATLSFTINLPAAHGREGMEFIIKKVNSTNTITVDTISGETIDGAGTKALTTQYSFIRVISDDANWHIIGGGSL